MERPLAGHSIFDAGTPNRNLELLFPNPACLPPAHPIFYRLIFRHVWLGAVRFRTPLKAPACGHGKNPWIHKSLGIAARLARHLILSSSAVPASAFFWRGVIRLKPPGFVPAGLMRGLFS
jgi:hypothetical protein